MKSVSHIDICCSVGAGGTEEKSGDLGGPVSRFGEQYGGPTALQSSAAESYVTDAALLGAVATPNLPKLASQRRYRLCCRLQEGDRALPGTLLGTSKFLF